MNGVLHFEDFAPGQIFALDGRYRVTAEEIVAFARDYDPQPHHLSHDAANQTVLGGLAASGWHVCAIAMRLFVDGLLNRSASAGGAGIEECRWLAPVRPGDELRAEIEILETRLPKSRGDFGFVKMRWDIFNADRRVAIITGLPMLKRRG